MLGRTGGGVPAVKAFCNPRERKSWEIVNKAASREGVWNVKLLTLERICLKDRWIRWKR